MRLIFGVAISLLLATGCGEEGKGTKKEAIGKEKAAGSKADASMINITGSRDINTLLCQRWEHKTDHELPYLNEDDEDEVPMRAFCFFNDSTLVKDPRNRLLTGKWTFDKPAKKISIRLDNGTREAYTIKAISYKTLLLQNDKSQEIEEYRANGMVHKNNADDPFYGQNLRWARKPAGIETEEAIREKMRSCVHFYYLFYMDAYKRKAKEVFFYGLPGAFKWYAGGIYIKKEKELTKKWLGIFYNAANAHAGYLILDKMMDKPYTWDAGAESWLLKNAGVLQQMENNI